MPEIKKRKNKIGLEFDGFEEAVAELKSLDGNVRAATEDALKESQKIIAGEAGKAMEKHHRTGDTEDSIVEDRNVEWEGFTAKIGAGFDLANGGLPSVFLMYGTPRFDKDQKLYNAVYGKTVKRKIAEIQEGIFAEAIRKRKR